MKIASWNVNSLNVRLPHLEQWLADVAPDVVGIQETKMEDHKFPDAVLAGLGYRSVFAGQKTYNGVALLSREPAQDVQIGIPGFEDEQKRAIAGTVNDTVLHFGINNLPFGGIGPSGMGAYHGRAGFDAMSPPLPILWQSRWAASDLLKPPYRGFVDRMVRFLAG